MRCKDKGHCRHAGQQAKYKKITVDHLFDDNTNTNSYRPSLDLHFHLEEGI